jgi:hypothetical protein
LVDRTLAVASLLTFLREATDMDKRIIMYFLVAPVVSALLLRLCLERPATPSWRHEANKWVVSWYGAFAGMCICGYVQTVLFIFEPYGNDPLGQTIQMFLISGIIASTLEGPERAIRCVRGPVMPPRFAWARLGIALTSITLLVLFRLSYLFPPPPDLP